MAVDTSRAPQGQIAAAKLVDEIVAEGDDRVETFYLEVKGPLDLTTKRDLAKVAKFILGAANRMPAVASRAFEGYAVLVIGVGDGVAVGVAPIEPLTISKGVLPYLGAEGPHWDVVRVPVSGSTKEVLVVVVDPPRVGQSPFICGKEGDANLRDGAVFVRANGETREANSGELAQLISRGHTTTRAPVDIEVGLVGEIVPIVIDEDRTLEEYVARERQALLDALPKPRVEPTSSPVTFASAGIHQAAMAQLSESLRASSILGGFGEIPESRTQQQYRAEIDAWEDHFRKAWTKAVRRLAGYALDPSEVSVENLATTFLHDVQLKVHLAGEVATLSHRELPRRFEDIELKLPWPPRAWGPRKKDFGIGALNPALYAAPSLRANDFRQSSSSWKNTGSVDIEIRVGDLRPEDTFMTDDEDAVLVVLGVPPEAVNGTWRATARGYDEVFTGEFSINVEEVRDLTRAMRHCLGLDEGEE